ncbi:hypothetical protein ACA910_013117 [Epithemia clementina (nom. ined.)]
MWSSRCISTLLTLFAALFVLASGQEQDKLSSSSSIVVEGASPDANAKIPPRPYLRTLQQVESTPSPSVSSSPTDGQGDFQADVYGISCGPTVICGDREICCSASCGLCTPPGQACVDVVCGATVP